MRFLIPLRLPSLNNLSHRHWRSLSAITNKQKAATRLVMSGIDAPPIPALPLLITITRVGPRRLDDDNLAGACKYVRDAIAAKVGVDDGSDLYTWRYEQRTGPYGVEVEIVTR